MSKWYQVFVTDSNDDAYGELEDMILNKGPDHVMDYILDMIPWSVTECPTWEYTPDMYNRRDYPWGDRDRTLSVLKQDGRIYVLAWNYGLAYITLYATVMEQDGV